MLISSVLSLSRIYLERNNSMQEESYVHGEIYFIITCKPKALKNSFKHPKIENSK